MSSTQKVAQLPFTFGTVTADVKVNGDVVNLDSLRDRLMATIITTLGAEVFQSGLTTSQYQALAAHRPQEYSWPMEHTGGISIEVKIGFELHHEVPVTTLNRMVYDTVFPEISRVIAQHIGERQFTTPEVTALPIDELHYSIGLLTGTSPQPTRRPGDAFLADTADDQSGRSRQRQLQ